MNPKRKFELSRKMKLGVGRAYSRGQMMKYSSFGFLAIAAILGINAVRLYIHQPADLHPQVLGAIDRAEASTTDTDGQYIEYTVEEGQTLFAIAQKYNISWTTLATLNNQEPPFTLEVGKKLRIPKR